MQRRGHFDLVFYYGIQENFSFIALRLEKDSRRRLEVYRQSIYIYIYSKKSIFNSTFSLFLFFFSFVTNTRENLRLITIVDFDVQPIRCKVEITSRQTLSSVIDSDDKYFGKNLIHLNVACYPSSA